MKIKRFTGKNIRQAICKVREVHGEDAVISDGRQVLEDLQLARTHDLTNRSVVIMQDIGVMTKYDPISTLIAGMAAHAHG